MRSATKLEVSLTFEDIERTIAILPTDVHAVNDRNAVAVGRIVTDTIREVLHVHPYYSEEDE